MRTLEEAIAHAREVSNSNKTKAAYDDELLKRFCTSKEACIKCAEENEQLARWLEELKAIKDGSIPIILGKAELEMHDKAIRNKAIDDFVEKFIYKAVCEGCSGCCNCHEEGRQNECEDYRSYMEIAEQLKAGGKNEI